MFFDMFIAKDSVPLHVTKPLIPSVMSALPGISCDMVPIPYFYILKDMFTLLYIANSLFNP